MYSITPGERARPAGLVARPTGANGRASPALGPQRRRMIDDAARLSAGITDSTRNKKLDRSINWRSVFHFDAIISNERVRACKSKSIERERLFKLFNFRGVV